MGEGKTLKKCHQRKEDFFFLVTSKISTFACYSKLKLPMLGSN